MVKFGRIENVSKIDIPQANWPVYNEELMLKITIWRVNAKDYYLLLNLIALRTFSISSYKIMIINRDKTQVQMFYFLIKINQNLINPIGIKFINGHDYYNYLRPVGL